MTPFERWMQINGVVPSRWFEWPVWTFTEAQAMADRLRLLAPGVLLAYAPGEESESRDADRLSKFFFPTFYGLSDWTRRDEDGVPGLFGVIGSYPPKGVARLNRVPEWLDRELMFQGQWRLENDGRGDYTLELPVWFPLSGEWVNFPRFAAEARATLNFKQMLMGRAVLEEDVQTLRLSGLEGAEGLFSGFEGVEGLWLRAREVERAPAGDQVRRVLRETWNFLVQLRAVGGLSWLEPRTENGFEEAGGTYIDRRLTSWWFSRLQDRVAFIWPGRMADVTGVRSNGSGLVVGNGMRARRPPDYFKIMRALRPRPRRVLPPAAPLMPEDPQWPTPESYMIRESLENLDLAGIAVAGLTAAEMAVDSVWDLVSDSLQQLWRIQLAWAEATQLDLSNQPYGPLTLQQQVIWDAFVESFASKPLEAQSIAVLNGFEKVGMVLANRYKNRAPDVSDATRDIGDYWSRYITIQDYPRTISRDLLTREQEDRMISALGAVRQLVETCPPHPFYTAYVVWSAQHTCADPQFLTRWWSRVRQRSAFVHGLDLYESIDPWA